MRGEIMILCPKLNVLVQGDEVLRDICCQIFIKYSFV